MAARTSHYSVVFKEGLEKANLAVRVLQDSLADVYALCDVMGYFGQLIVRCWVTESL